MLLYRLGMNWKMTWLIWTLIMGIPQFLPALTIEEGILDPRLRQAWEKVKINRPTEALESLSAIPQNPVSAVYYHFIYGRALEKLEKSSEAMDHYRSAYFCAPSEALKELTLLERADGYFRIKNYYESKTSYSLFIKQFNHSGHIERANMGMAQSLTRIGALAEALPYYERSGSGVEAQLGKANLLHRLGRFKEAHEGYLKGIALNKSVFINSEENLLFFGENLQQMGKDQEAASYLRTPFKNPVWKLKADFDLGLMALKEQKWEEAQKYFQSARTSTERKTKQEALVHLAEALWGAGKKMEAKKLFLDYKRENPSGKVNTETQLKLVQLDMEEGQTEQASNGIKELIQRTHPKKETIQALEGVILKLKDKDPQRLSLLWNSIGQKLLPLCDEAFLMQLVDSLKKFGKPFVEIQQWLVQHGSQMAKINALIALATYQTATGNSIGALNSIKTLKKFKVTGDEILRLEAGILYAREEYGQAIERLLSVKKMEPRDIPLLEETLLSARDLNKALTVFEKTLTRIEGNSGNYIKLADLLYQRGNRKTALQYYQKALEKDPLNEWALFRTGSLLHGEEAQKKWAGIKNENSLVGRLAKASLREKEVERKFEENFK
jgi:tetratricopeptide (TPR) repeat protein